ncbi:uncharacterized protein LOC127121456 [Lathyrus oleraceus]|uniref:Uncharacterized protein n=1 Tax=Pisum sativum TaxID=3888 RepID=A0A9D5BBI6_PEA|nr:uncharacterized protein LOC127121456 [Pisum sativum]KAI5437705.1 hypothetical protein KIW84_023718 [Pisum sativum]
MGDNDNAQNFTIGGGSSAEGLVNNIIENLNEVHLNDNSEQGAPPSNLEKLTEPTASKRTSRMISNEHGCASAGVVQNITSIEKTNDIVEEIENSKEVNSNDYDITKEEKNSKKVKLNEYETTEEKKAMIDSQKVIGCDIYKEFEGVKSLGTVTTYITSLKLFEIIYKNDGRLEYLDYNEVLSHLAEKDKTYKIQLVKPKRNMLEVRREIARELAKAFAAFEEEEEITSKRKMENSPIIEGKNSSKKEKISSGASPNKVEQTEVIPQSKENAKSKKNENSKNSKNSKSACKRIKKESETKRGPWHAKRENATEEEPYEPYQFRGLYICKEFNGIRSLGNVIGYCPKKNKLIIQYKTDDSIEYMTQLETLRSMAKRADVMPSPSASGSKKKTDKKKNNDEIEKASTSGTKKTTASGGPKV